ncbi:ABC transporter substrate-binding protein [Streptomyces sp. NBC_01803]|uniref:ABC transporter substrate-binding protein n=1 Tax=Streptomyces sp. NBC_01803 TaxID=2975946 RepID=UPI002DD88700|nr:ABC transporter substrate-binding protein [Streptomyces sp. NBC_01803]WSA44085.1 ABC transporter substrate-binding protein [Streptomyces sp. NBC_01803]
MTVPPEPDPPIRWYRTRWGRGLVLAAVLAVLGAGSILVFGPEDTSCADGVEEIGEGDERECVGLTDGGFRFSEELGDVFELIRAENDAVLEEADGSEGVPYVSVVYLLPMTPDPGYSNTRDSVRHELEGAYAAQFEANNRLGHGESPHIRLLLAHPGRTDAQRRFTVGEITGRRADDRIVAVAGLGTSLRATQKTVADLAEADIASFGTVLTSDRLAEVRGLVRVAPPNADQAAAAVQYLSEDGREDDRVLLVRDANEEDQYTATLAEEFARQLPEDRFVPGQPMQFDSSQSGLATYFDNEMANLCLQRPDVVYFAGRSRDLVAFLGPLAHRQCQDAPLTVLSGDDASQTVEQDTFEDVRQAVELGRIELAYTSLAHPGAWEEATTVFSPTAVSVFRPGGTYTTTFPDSALDDGQAIMAHDAVLTAVEAIRSVATPEYTDITSSDVFQQITTLHDANAVAGASGWISIGPDGSPENKAIPVVRIHPDGGRATVDVTSADGAPYTPPRR